MNAPPPVPVSSENMNLSQHYAPKYNLFGYQIPQKVSHPNATVLQEKVKSLGRNDRRGCTFSEVQQQRKNDILPHKSFDLNGDGVVCKISLIKF